ncbi:hypothetical protein E4U13_004443 [Claviceps humidiphila]|uniref:Uncharacterized protein n=1 Tax=Claviceps humidiphila TaxID=1294629 RepID=A0A9P7QAS8_9HYPO|nr:hypothetical protein E4U13_004443 [Claviceps humidiphila]
MDVKVKILLGYVPSRLCDTGLRMTAQAAKILLLSTEYGTSESLDSRVLSRVASRKGNCKEATARIRFVMGP